MRYRSYVWCRTDIMVFWRRRLIVMIRCWSSVVSLGLRVVGWCRLRSSVVERSGRDGLAVLIDVNNHVRRVCGDSGDFCDDGLRTLVVFMGNCCTRQHGLGMSGRAHTYGEVLRP